jgi:hypothetical protein
MQPIGDVNGDQTSDFVTGTWTATRSTTTLVFRTISGRNASTLWTRTLTAPSPVTEEDPCAVYYDLPGIYFTVDHQGDGVADWPIHFCHPDANGQTHSYMVSGRDGSLVEWPFDVTRTDTYGGDSLLHGSVDGVGDDAVFCSASATAMHVVDGRDQHTIWTAAASACPAWYAVSDLTGDGRAEVMAYAAQSGHSSYRFYDGSTGALRWTYLVS